MELYNNCRRGGIRLILVCIAFILPMQTSAQTLNLYDAVEKTVDNYPLIRQKQAELAAGNAHIATVKNNRLPSLVLEEQATLGSDNPIEGAYFSLGISPSTPGSYTTVHQSPILGNTAISFLKWEFYNFGSYRAQQKAATAGAAVSAASLSSTQYLVTESVITLYLDWLKKYKLLQVEQENVDRAAVLLTDIRAHVTSGLKPGTDTNLAQAAFSAAKIAYLQAMDNFNYDRIEMETYTGLHSDLLIPDTTSLAGISHAGDFPVAETVPVTHPLVDFYQKQYELQLAGNIAVSKQFLPHFELIGAAWVRNSSISFSGVYPESIADGMPYSRSNYLLGINLSWNVFDLRHLQDQLTEGRFMAQAKDNSTKDQQLNLEKMLREANSAYATTNEKLKEIPVQLASARQAFEQQMALYRSGLNTLVEVTNAQFLLQQAESNYIIAEDELLQVLYIRAALADQSNNFLLNFKR